MSGLPEVAGGDQPGGFRVPRHILDAGDRHLSAAENRWNRGVYHLRYLLKRQPRSGLFHQNHRIGGTTFQRGKEILIQRDFPCDQLDLQLICRNLKLLTKFGEGVALVARKESQDLRLAVIALPVDEGAVSVGRDQKTEFCQPFQRLADHGLAGGSFTHELTDRWK